MSLNPDLGLARCLDLDLEWEREWSIRDLDLSRSLLDLEWPLLDLDLERSLLLDPELLRLLGEGLLLPDLDLLLWSTVDILNGQI